MFFPFKLNSTLGRDYNVDLDDTLRAKKALKKVGAFETPPHGLTEFPDEPLFQGIEKFQKQHDLRQDGVMKPDGETATKLGQVLAVSKQSTSKPRRRNQKLAALGLSANVGLGHTNRPHDVISTKRALAWAGHSPFGRSVSHEESVDQDMVASITEFQNSAGLKVDGFLRPHGETEKTVNRVLGPKIHDAQKQANEAQSQEKPDRSADHQEALAVGPIPPIVYKVAEFFGMALVATWAWWESMSQMEKNKVRDQINGYGSDGGNEEQCEFQYDIDTETCNGVTRNRGKQAGARCHASAASRYEACLRGIPIDRLPPLDVWNN